MSDVMNPAKRPVSERKLAANRRNALRSTGPTSIDGLKHSSMNRLLHGMCSSKILLPGESQADYDALKDAVTAVLAPCDAVEELLRDHAVDTAWYTRRGKNAANSRGTTIIRDLVNGAADAEAKEAERLAPLLDEDRDALRQLRRFPTGVALLREQWSNLYDLVSGGVNLLATQRRRCLSLIGKRKEDVFRDDRTATLWIRSLIGAMYGSEASFDEVAGFFNNQPPEGMSRTEFSIRVERLAGTLPTRAESQALLEDYIIAVMDELDALQECVDQEAEAALADKASGA
jgi:hypothetical protein